VDALYQQFLKIADSKKEIDDQDLQAMAKNYQSISATV
jgi:2-isopropylmalate synthase